MRKDSLVILTMSVLVTAAVFSAAHYASGREERVEIDAHGKLEPLNLPEWPEDEPHVSAETPYARTDQIIECHDPKVGKFYTNAAGCEGADLENRLSDYQTLWAPPTQSQFKRARSAGIGRQAKSNAKPQPNLRLTGRSPPSGLPPECKFPVGKALEIERPLSAASDPYQSIWRVDYCRFRCEAVREGCPVSDVNFHFSFSSMCPNSTISCFPTSRQ